MAEIRVCCGGGGKRSGFKFKIYIQSLEGDINILSEAWAYGQTEEDAANQIPRIYKGAIKAVGASGSQYSFE